MHVYRALVLTLRAAAALLSAADSPSTLAELVAATGHPGVLRPLDATHRAALGITEVFRDAQIIAGPGDLRTIVARISQGPPLREQLAKLAARLQARAPQMLWLVVAADPRENAVALAVWDSERRPPRVRSLIVDRAHIMDSDAETLCALAASMAHDDMSIHIRWTEVLGRDALSRRFYEELEQRVASLAASATGADEDDRRALALLDTSRLLFLAFLEAKGWLNGHRTFLSALFDDCMAHNGGFHRRVLRPLFFGTLNTPSARRAPAAHAFGRVPFLNGGLFAPTSLEKRHRHVHFSDEAFGALLGGLFARYRFTAREDATTWSDAAIDPEMLGRAFESLMAFHDRRDSGAFFTPQPLVAHITDITLAELLQSHGMDSTQSEALVVDGTPPSTEHNTLRRRLLDSTLLDPACGSGAFLVHALQRLGALHRVLGDPRPDSEIRRDVLTRSIFGVDRNPMAVWLCELRLWLSVVIECDADDPMRVAPLPNLDRNVRVGDSLAGPGFATDVVLQPGPSKSRLLRRYAASSGARKITLARTLDYDERSRAIALLDRTIESAHHARRERLVALRGADLFGNRRTMSAADRTELEGLRTRIAALRRECRRLSDGGALPFRFAVHFADVAARGGFDAVIGNPPWVRIHRIPPAERPSLRREYFAYRNAPWQAGAEAAQASAGFAGQVDLSALFVERSLALLKPGGVLALLVPAKLWRSLAGGGLRQLLTERAQVIRLEDRTDAPPSFDAAVYPSIVAVRRGPAATRPPDITAVVQRGSALAVWTQPAGTPALDNSPGAPWLLLPQPARRAFDHLSSIGTPLGQTPFGRPLLGVKCGCNDAFVVELMDERGGVACIRAAGGRTGEIEASMLRPVVRGETVRAWGVKPNIEHIAWPYDKRGHLLQTLPPRAARWFARYKRRLIARADARSAQHWWTLFRTDGAAFDVPRVVWADFGRSPRALVLPAGERAVPLNTCYVARCGDLDDARALAAILNSPIAAAWLSCLAEPARGGFKRYLGWTMARLPLPSNWARARGILAPFVADLEARHALDALTPACLLEIVLDAYGVHQRVMAPLLTWSTP